MAYITIKEYVELYGQPAISEADFPVYAGQASDLIDSITQYRIIRAGGLSTFPPLVQQLVTKATAAQVLYFIQNGRIETVLSGQTGAGYTVGKVHVDGAGASGGAQTAAQMMISPLAVTLLEQTGLMGRRIRCLDPFQPPYYGIR